MEYFNEPADRKFLEDEDFIRMVKENRTEFCPVEEGLRSLLYVEASCSQLKWMERKCVWKIIKNVGSG